MLVEAPPDSSEKPDRLPISEVIVDTAEEALEDSEPISELIVPICVEDDEEEVDWLALACAAP